MTQIALFHSVLGVRTGIVAAADRFRAAGHKVLVVDQYNGRVFDSYDDGNAHVQSLGGYPELMRSAIAGVNDLPDGFIAAGFSNGAGMAEYVSTVRSVAGTLMFSGALPLAMIGAKAWPSRVPAQIHYTQGDPFRHPGWAEELAEAIRTVNTSVEVFDYAGGGHLFTDPSLPEEYDADAAQLLWRRALEFCSRADRSQDR